MRALTLVPGQLDSLSVTTVPQPEPGPGELLVEGLAVGVCGIDREIVSGAYGWAPAGEERLVLGHESLGRVTAAPEDSGFDPGDLVVGVARQPDPQPCGACARGESDMCRTGRYAERGVKLRHGYGSQLWTVEADHAVRIDPRLESVGVLLEPAAVAAKAWEQIDRVTARAWFEPRTVLVAGAGPTGLLAALLGRQRGLDVHVLDQVGTGVKPRLVAGLGATHHCAPLTEVAAKLRPDIVIEATGDAALALDAVESAEPAATVCLIGSSAAGVRTVPLDAGAAGRSLVLENEVVLRTVSANRRHFLLAADALAEAGPGWLERLITRRFPLKQALDAFEPADGSDVKIVIELNP
ncbi:glucose 1-dehydrogenase [Kitasatospora sp. NPDC048365]|uniref:glucose 1-dehydrogenase n=1 Tax=Kitasatospora sp. NPDC048365 TaxID=3364050 RepID=UPI003718CC69